MKHYFIALALLMSGYMLVAHSETLSVGIVYSPYTDNTLKAIVTSNLDTILSDLTADLEIEGHDANIFEATVTYDEPTYPTEFDEENVLVILDLTQNFALSQIFVFEAMEKDLLHIVLRRSLSYEGSEAIGNNSLYMENKLLDIEDQLLYDLVTNYNWTQALGIIKTSNLKMLKLAQDFKERCIESDITISGEIIIELGITDDDQDVISSRIRESLRLKNVRFVVMFADDKTSANVIRAGVESLNGSGYAWIIASTGAAYMDDFTDLELAKDGLYKNGIITFRMDDPLSDLEVEISSLLSTAADGFIALHGDSDSANENGTSLRDFFMDADLNNNSDEFSFDADGSRIIDYNILNSRAGVMEVSGSWNSQEQNISILADDAGKDVILWPGGKYEPPKDDKSTITLCLLYPQTEDEAEYEYGLKVKQGFDLAIETINNDSTSDLYENFEFEAIEFNTATDPGDLITDMKTKSFLGCVGPMTGDKTKGILDAAKANEYRKNFISYGSDWKDLTSTENYASSVYFYLSTMQSVSALSKAIVLYLSFNNWKQVGIIHTTTREKYNDPSYEPEESDYAYDYGVSLMESYKENLEGGIKQEIRSEDKLPEFLASDDLETVNEVLHNVVVNKARILLFFGRQEDGIIILREAHKWKLWGEDYLWIGADWLDEDIINQVKASNSNDHSEVFDVMDGAISVKPLAEVEESGEDFTNNFMAAYGPDSEGNDTNEAEPGVPVLHSYFAYDSVFVYAKAIEKMVRTGKDFTNVSLLDTEFRTNIEFTGATGTIKFKSNANERVGAVQIFTNFQGRNKGMVPVTTFKIEGSHSFDDIEDNNTKWGELVSARPSGDVVDNNCPFDDNNVTYDGVGFGIVIGLCLCILVITIAISFVSLRKWRSISIVRLDKETEKTWKDWAIEIFIVVEFFQFLALAPPFESNSAFLKRIIGLAMFDLLDLIGQGGSPYFFWVSVYIIISLCFLWFLLVILNMINIEERLERQSIQRVLSSLTNVLLPLIGNTCFLPFIKLLVDIFVCHQKAFEGIDGYEHTFVERDCHTHCWEGDHTLYVILGSIALVFYLPFAVFSRPLWEKAKTDVNIQLGTTFLLLKTCAQVFFIGLKKVVIYPVIHAALYIPGFSLFAFFTYKKWPFNYDVINLWQVVMFISVIYYSILSFLGMLTGSETALIWLILLLVGWATIMMVGAVIMKKKFKVLLISPKRNRNSSMLARLNSKKKDQLPNAGKTEKSKSQASKDSSLDVDDDKDVDAAESMKKSRYVESFNEVPQEDK